MHDNRHAVVSGSGISGSLAARVLLDHFERVAIVDWDRFPDLPDHRAGFRSRSMCTVYRPLNYCRAMLPHLARCEAPGPR